MKALVKTGNEDDSVLSRASRASGKSTEEVVSLSTNGCSSISNTWTNGPFGLTARFWLRRSPLSSEGAGQPDVEVGGPFHMMLAAIDPWARSRLVTDS